MSVAVLKEPAVDAAAMRRELEHLVGFVSDEGLPVVVEWLSDFLTKEAEAWEPPSEEDYSPEFYAAMEEAMSEPGTVSTFEEFYDYVEEVADDAAEKRIAERRAKRKAKVSA